MLSPLGNLTNATSHAICYPRIIINGTMQLACISTAMAFIGHNANPWPSTRLNISERYMRTPTQSACILPDGLRVYIVDQLCRWSGRVAFW